MCGWRGCRIAVGVRDIRGDVEPEALGEIRPASGGDVKRDTIGIPGRQAFNRLRPLDDGGRQRDGAGRAPRVYEVASCQFHCQTRVGGPQEGGIKAYPVLQLSRKGNTICRLFGFSAMRYFFHCRCDR
jgi:hypothetical protein